jgi:prephenate dehydrogenase
MDSGGFSIAIVGLGLIGGSMAEALMESKGKDNFKVSNIYGIDNNVKNIVKAIALGIIDDGSDNAEEFLNKSDIVILSIYPESIIRFIKGNIHNFKEGSIITDTCGIKGNIIENILELLPSGIDFVGGHPMAGKEKQGIDMADKGIFTKANFILTPVKENKAYSIDIVKEVAKAIGCRSIISIPPKEHDEIIAYTSQMPHIMAVSLVNSNRRELDITHFIGGSYKDATRVAAINSELWSELLLSNSENVLNCIGNFQKSLNDIKEAIEAKNREKLISLLKTSASKLGE